MAEKFLQIAVTDSVRKAQETYYGGSIHLGPSITRDILGPDERGFIASRDSFYMASVTEDGWPYIQHRGGKAGFLHVVGDQTLAFADYRGNQQLLTTGNVAVSDRVALFLMDYPSRSRLKILGHARVEDAREHPELVEQLAEPAFHRVVERLFFIDVVGYDWNCPKYITPRFTAAEVQEAVQPLKQRIAELEAELAKRGSK